MPDNGVILRYAQDDREVFRDWSPETPADTAKGQRPRHGFGTEVPKHQPTEVAPAGRGRVTNPPHWEGQETRRLRRLKLLPLYVGWA